MAISEKVNTKINLIKITNPIPVFSNLKNDGPYLPIVSKRLNIIIIVFTFNAGDKLLKYLKQFYNNFPWIDTPGKTIKVTK